MKLIIAEKPSLARNIAAAIGPMQRRDGYLEGEGYVITWVFGHLFGLVDIEAYTAPDAPADAKARWTMDNLPCFPDTFRYELRRGDNKKVDPGVAKQFRLIEALCNRPDTEMIINAGDADREGEIIVRTCVEKALQSPKPQKRLWLPDQTPQTVKQALSELKDDADYDSLANEGYARTFIDWLYGVNLTRYATLSTGKLLRVGRVIVPIVKAIYDRDLSIRNFVPRTYYAPTSTAVTHGEKVELVSKEEFPSDKKEQAEAYCAALNSAGATVVDKKTKETPILPGKLYSLSTLQNVLGKKYKLSMKDSLETVQSLYEKGYLTYPRTNSEYLATAEKDKVRAILSGVAKLGYPVVFRDAKRIFDDSKIESHSALTPTYKIPAADALTERERQVYSTVFRRFVAVFCKEECLAEKSELTIRVGDLETFTLRGTVILSPGWTKYDDAPLRDKVLPALNVGDAVNIRFRPAEKQTNPPKHYTIETLNNYLKNPFREDKAALADRTLEDLSEDDAEDYRAIFEGLELGTEATRTGIIDNARKTRYIDLKKDVYTILPDGEFLIESLGALHISMDKYKTSELGRALKQVYKGTMTVRDSVKLAEEEIAAVFARSGTVRYTPPKLPEGFHGRLGEIMGACPLCGKNVICGKSSYGCMGYAEGCQFRVPFTLCSRPLSKGEVTELLAKGKTDKLFGFRSRAGKSFSAALEVMEGKVEFDFHKKQEQTSTATAKGSKKASATPKAPKKPRKTAPKTPEAPQ